MGGIDKQDQMMALWKTVLVKTILLNSYTLVHTHPIHMTIGHMNWTTKTCVSLHMFYQ